MEENTLFRWVWRFNGLIIMVAGMLAIGVLAFAGYKMFKEVTRERNVRNMVNIHQENDVKETWKLGYMSEISGSPYVMIPLHSNQRYALSYASKSSKSSRNYLFIHSETNEKYWLFNTNTYLIDDIDFLSEKPYGKDEREVRAILYKIVKHDTNNDKRLTDNDRQTIALSLPSGKGYKEIVEGIDVFIGHRLIDTHTLLIVFQREGRGFSANVRLADFTLSNQTELPKVNP